MAASCRSLSARSNWQVSPEFAKASEGVTVPDAAAMIPIAAAERKDLRVQRVDKFMNRPFCLDVWDVCPIAKVQGRIQGVAHIDPS